LSKRIDQGLLESEKEFKIPIPILANFIAGSFLTLLQWWLENKMVYSPEEMDKIFKELIMAGLEKKNDENKTTTL
jgi:tetracycline repressor-like protein